MRAPAVLVLLCVVIAVHGQESYRTEPVRKGWMIGLGVSPEMAFRTLGSHRGYSIEHDRVYDRERPRSAYTAGLYANYFYNDTWGIGTGIAYSLKGFHVERRYITEFLEGRPVPFVPYHLTATYGYESLDLPITAVMRMGRGRLRSITHVGLAGNFFWGERYRFFREFDDGRTTSGLSVNRSFFHGGMGLSGVISTGVEYRISEQLQLRIEPNFHTELWTSRPSRDAYRSLHWNAGINVSAFIDLR